MKNNLDPRRRVLSRLKEVGVATSVIEYAEKKGYGKDTALWEFADILGLTSEIMQKLPGQIASSRNGTLSTAKPLSKNEGMESLHQYAEKKGYGKDTALWEFVDLLNFVVEKMQNLPDPHQPRIKNEPLATKQHPTFKLLKSISPFFFFLLFFGWMIIEVGKTPLILALIGLVAGVLLGVLGMLLWREDLDHLSEKQRVNSAAKLPQESVKVWTEAEFMKVSSSINLTISDRTFSACLDVLVNKMEVNDAAKIHNTMPAQITRILFAMRSK